MKFREGDIITHNEWSNLDKVIIEIEDSHYKIKDKYGNRTYGEDNSKYRQKYIEKFYHKIGVDRQYQKGNHIKKINCKNKSIISKIISFFKEVNL